VVTVAPLTRSVAAIVYGVIMLRDNRQHSLWSIENSCHYILDWNYDEDRCRISKGCVVARTSAGDFAKLIKFRSAAREKRVAAIKNCHE